MNLYLILLIGIILVFYAHIKRLEKKIRYAVKINHKLNQDSEAVLSFLDKVGSSLKDLTNLESTLKIVLDFIMDGTTAQAGAILLLDPDGKRMWCRCVSGPFPPQFDTSAYVATKAKYLEEAIKMTPVSVEESILGESIKSGNTLIYRKDGEESSRPTFLENIDNMIVEPLKIRQKILGVVAIVDKEVGAFDSDDARFVSSLSSQVAVMIDTAKMYQERAETERIERELTIARDIQKILIPQNWPHIDNFELSFKSIPAKEVGGDYYDIFRLNDGKYGIVIADVCGKGVPGALVMTMLRSVLRTRALTGLSPGQVLTEVNSLIYDDMKRDMFITVLYAILDPKNKKLVFARAGHNPLLVFQSDSQKYESYMPDGVALGLVKDSEELAIFPDEEISLDRGDLVFFTTDGVEEAMNRLNEVYGEDRAKEIIKVQQHADAQTIVEQVLSDLHNFARGTEQSDDITLGMIKVL